MSLMKRSRPEFEWPDLSEWLASRRLPDWPEGWLPASGESLLRVEQFECDGALVVRADLPGVDPEHDVEVTVSDHTLRIKAERHQTREHEAGKGYRTEFRYGSFLRTMALPAGASEDGVEASYADGVLEVRIPVHAGLAGTRTVPISRPV